MKDVEKLEKLASAYKEAAGPAAAALMIAGKYMLYAWFASGIAEYMTRKNPALANLKESLAELIELVQGADQSKMAQEDRTIIARFLSSAKEILPQIDRVRSIQQPDAKSISDLEQFMRNARFVAYNAHNVANIMDKIETWYAGVGSFLVSTFGFGLEVTDVRRAKARANEIAATLGPMISGLEILLEKTVNQAQQMAAAQQAKAVAVPATPGDQVSEFAVLQLA